ncbi:MAG: oligosaccharide flippase family protein [Pseudomonadales bacterium]|nr:oligosaccharide flippase family protein [Pseudomonadales bacterium]
MAGRLASLLFVCKSVDFPNTQVLKSEFLRQWPAAKWLLPGALLGALALQLLPLGMTFAVGAASAGLFLLVYRMVVIPNSILSKVASDTLLVEFSRLEQAGDAIAHAVENGLGKLLLTALCFYGALAVHGQWVFSLLLGEAWNESVQLIPWLALLVGFWSVASPMAMVFVSLKDTQWSFWLSGLDVANRSAALFAGLIYQDIQLAAASLAIGGTVVYGITITVALRLSRAGFVAAVAPIVLSFIGIASLLAVANALLISGWWGLSILMTLVATIVCAKKLFNA